MPVYAMLTLANVCIYIYICVCVCVCMCVCRVWRKDTLEIGRTRPYTHAHTGTHAHAGEGINGMILTNWIPPFDRFFLFVPPHARECSNDRERERRRGRENERGRESERAQKINDTDVRARLCLRAPPPVVYTYLPHIYIPTHVIYGIICVTAPRPTLYVISSVLVLTIRVVCVGNTYILCRNNSLNGSPPFDAAAMTCSVQRVGGVSRTQLRVRRVR